MTTSMSKVPGLVGFQNPNASRSQSLNLALLLEKKTVAEQTKKHRKDQCAERILLSLFFQTVVA